MRESIAAVALIRREQDGQRYWLAQWNRHWQRYHFVGGHKRPEESFRECVVREVSEELGLRDSTDFRAAAEPLARVEYTAWSESAAQETHYTMELFDVELAGDTAWQTVDGDSRNRWLTETEIRAQRCADGQPASESMVRLLTTAKLLAEDETATLPSS